MPPSMKEEIAFVTKIIAEDSIELSTPFAHMVN